MPSLFSKWMMYISSYIYLYVLLIIKVVFFGKDKLINNLASNLIFVVILGILFIISICWQAFFSKWEMNSRTIGKVEENITYEMLSFLLPYIVSLLTIEIDGYGIIINITIFLILGIAFISSDKIYFSSFFILTGYKLYKNKNVYYLCRMSKEQLNIKMAEEKDGIECREIGKQIYWIKEKKF